MAKKAPAKKPATKKAAKKRTAEQIALDRILSNVQDIYPGLCDKGKAIVKAAAKARGKSLKDILPATKHIVYFDSVKFETFAEGYLRPSDFTVTGSLTITHKNGDCVVVDKLEVTDVCTSY